MVDMKHFSKKGLQIPKICDIVTNEIAGLVKNTRSVQFITKKVFINRYTFGGKNYEEKNYDSALSVSNDSLRSRL